MYLTPVFFAQILHSFPYFFILVFPTAFYLRSRMTGRYLVPFCKNRLFVSATLISILCFLLQLTPFVNLSVDTFLRQTGTAFYVIHFSILWFDLYKKLWILFSLVVRFPRTRREVPSLRGDRGMLVYTGQKRYRFLLTLIFILLFLLTLAPFDGYFCVSHFNILQFHS